ncbi:MAG: PmoA family protein [Thermoguttaceae bacterium]
MKNLIFTITVLFFFGVGTAYASEISLDKTERGAEVKIDGKLFTGYVTDQDGQPIIWPIIGPTGKKMTRSYPMISEGEPGEQKDHEHHRSLWFTHGEVSGNNFWLVTKDLSKRCAIVHKKFNKLESDGKKAVIETENYWTLPNGTELCKDDRTFTFFEKEVESSNGNGKQTLRIIDCDIILTSLVDDLLFGDTKEGLFAVRVASSMDVDAKDRKDKVGGKIVNAEGKVNTDAWAQRSAWCDYSGPIESETVGITILNHPDSFRFPTYWHVRNYGLFAANPFGEHDFKGTAEKTGDYILKKGESIKFRYRVILHTDSADSFNIEKEFNEYSN